MTNDPIFRHQLYKVSQWGEIIFKDELIFFVQFWILTRVFMKQINYEKIKTDLEKLLQVYENKNTTFKEFQPSMFYKVIALHGMLASFFKLLMG